MEATNLANSKPNDVTDVRSQKTISIQNALATSKTTLWVEKYAVWTSRKIIHL